MRTIGADDGMGLTYTVKRPIQNGKTRKSIVQPWRQLCFSMLGELATTAIIALAAFLLSLYHVQRRRLAFYYSGRRWESQSV